MAGETELDCRASVLRALRPFSLVVALATCSLGTLLAELDGVAAPWLWLPCVLAGLLLQAGVNLITDHADLNRLPHTERRRRQVIVNARLGAGAIVLACLIGCTFVVLRGWPMILLGALGVLGAWGYSAAPLDLKSRGLGLPAVFLLTGVLMVAGSYFAVSGTLNPRVLAFSLPYSVFAALLLLANELRDFEADQRAGISTYTARGGLQRGVRLYRLLVLALLVATSLLGMFWLGLWIVLPVGAALLLVGPLRRLGGTTQTRMPLARQTGRAYFVFALCLTLAVGLEAAL